MKQGKYGSPNHRRTRSQEGKSWQRWYKSDRWRNLRRRQLAAHPLCQCPHCREGKGALREATVVDHIKAHKGDRKLFFDPTNLQSFAKSCHDTFKQSEEAGGQGFMKGRDERGYPLNLAHSWYEAR